MIVLGVGEDVGQGVHLGGGLVGVLDTRLAIVVDGGALGIPKARCSVYYLDRRPLSLRMSQFTSTASPTR